MRSDRMTMAELGEALGIEKSQVSKLAARGMPIDDVDAARAWRAGNLNPLMTHEGRTSAAKPPAAAASSDASDLMKSRARREAAQAEREEIALAKEKRALCEGELVRRALFSTHRMLRDQLLSVPNRLAAQVVGVTPQEAAELIRAEIRRCLTEFSELNDEAIGQILGDGVQA